MEDYLEAILMIREANGYCRSIDVAKKLGYSKPSVSIAVSKLRDEGYLMDKVSSGDLRLTEKGIEVAKRIAERHQFFSEWLIHLGVDPKTAYADACGIEHWLSEDSFREMKNYITKKEKEDHGGDISFLKR